MSDLSLQRFRYCAKCGCTKPLTAVFFFRESVGGRGPNTSGFKYGCKVCFLVRQAATRLKNREQHLARERERSKAAHIKANRREYTEQNRELYREASRKWRDTHPGKQYESTQKWRKANPDKVAGYHRKRRARKLGAEHEPYNAAA